MCTLAVARAVYILEAPLGDSILTQTTVDSHEEVAVATFYEDVLALFGRFEPQTDPFVPPDTTEETVKIKSMERSLQALWMALIEMQSTVRAMSCALLMYTLLTTTLLTFQCLQSRIRRADKVTTTAIVEPIQLGNVVRDDVKKISQV